MKFSEKFPEAVDASSAEKNREEILGRRLAEELRFVAERLTEAKKSGAKYAVVGGAALAAWSGADYKPVRENGTARDLDVVVLDDPENKIENLNALIQERRQRDGFLLPIDFSKAKEPGYRSGAQLLTHFQKGEGGYYLAFRKVKKKLSDELLETKPAELKIGNISVNFETFELGVLLHLYIQRVGSLKAKDKDKVAELLRWPAFKENKKEHSRYQVFHDFAEELRTEYPKYSAAIKIYNTIDHLIFNSLISHKFIPQKIFKFLINL